MFRGDRKGEWWKVGERQVEGGRWKGFIFQRILSKFEGFLGAFLSYKYKASLSCNIEVLL